MNDFTTTHARDSDIDTSYWAAESAEEMARVHKAIVLEALKKYGPMTSQEITYVTDLDHAQTWRRVSDLKNAGLIVDTGERRLNSSKRKAAVWQAVYPAPK